MELTKVEGCVEKDVRFINELDHRDNYNEKIVNGEAMLGGKTVDWNMHRLADIDNGFETMTVFDENKFTPEELRFIYGELDGYTIDYFN